MAGVPSDRLLNLLEEARSEIVEEIRRRQSTSEGQSSNQRPGQTSSSLTTPPPRSSQTTSASTPTSVLAELRSRFQPYPVPPGGQRFRITGRSVTGRQTTTLAQRTWRCRFYCLLPGATKTPTAHERIDLADEGLGDAVITIGNNATTDELISKIKADFPRLTTFELLRCAGTGGFGKPLTRICSKNPVPDVPYLKVARPTTIFIRPLEDLLPRHENEGDDGEGGSAGIQEQNQVPGTGRGCTQDCPRDVNLTSPTDSAVLPPALLETSSSSVHNTSTSRAAQVTSTISSMAGSDTTLDSSVEVDNISNSTTAIREHNMNHDVSRTQFTSEGADVNSEETPSSGAQFTVGESDPNSNSSASPSLAITDGGPSTSSGSEVFNLPRVPWSRRVRELRASEDVDTDDDDEFTTMAEFKAKVLRQNPGIQPIFIARKNYLEKLFGVYKNPNINLLKEVKVEFVNEVMSEPGSDYGGLSREYFWKGFLSLTKEKLDGRGLFEGGHDHMIPAADGMLSRTGVFKFLGKFMAHSAIHCGIAIVGLSEAIVEYLTTEDICTDTPIPITEEDISDSSQRAILSNLRKLQSGDSLSDEENIQIQQLALSSDFLDKVTPLNARDAIMQIMYYQVIERRKAYLDTIKKEFKSTGLLTFLQKHPYLRGGVFPRLQDIKYPTHLILERIVYTGCQSVVAIIQNYFNTLNEDEMTVLLKAWTGWPILPEDKLRVTVEEDCVFEVRTCFEQISVPSSATEEDIKIWFGVLLQNPEGFGMV